MCKKQCSVVCSPQPRTSRQTLPELQQALIGSHKGEHACQLLWGNSPPFSSHLHCVQAALTEAAALLAPSPPFSLAGGQGATHQPELLQERIVGHVVPNTNVPIAFYGKRTTHPSMLWGQRRKGDPEAALELGRRHKARGVASWVNVPFLPQIHGRSGISCLRGGYQVHSSGAPVQTV